MIYPVFIKSRTCLLCNLGESSKAAEQSSKLHRYGGSSSKSDHTFQEPKAASRSQKKVAGGISKQSKRSTSDTKSSSGLISSSRTPRPHEMDVKKNKKDKSIIEEIKNAMGKFERFSEHCREVPRFMHRPVATSTPFMDRYDDIQYFHFYLKFGINQF